jgi:hypothetical protein
MAPLVGSPTAATSFPVRFGQPPNGLGALCCQDGLGSRAEHPEPVTLEASWIQAFVGGDM